MNEFNTIVVSDVHLQDSRYISPSYDAWLMSMYRQCFKEINRIITANNITKLVLSGDMFDAPPKHIALMLFDEFMTNLPECITEKYILAGNHCLMGQVSTKVYYIDIMKEFFESRYGLKVMGYEYDQNNNLYCSHQHIEKLERLRQKPRIVFTHFRSGINKVAVDEIDVVPLMAQTKLVVAGDIHKRLAYENIVYAGAPIDTHFGIYSTEESKQPSVLLLNEQTLQWKWETTLSTHYRKKKLVFGSVQEFFEVEEDLKKEAENFKTYFKIIIQDKKFNIRQIDVKDYKAFAKLQFEVTDVQKNEVNREIIDKITDNLSKKSVTDNLLEFIEENNGHPEWIHDIRALFASFERKII